MILTLQRVFELEKLEGSIVTFVNPFSYYELIKKVDKLDLGEFAIFADGIGVVILYNVFLNKKIKRYAFDNTSIAPAVLSYSEEKKLKVFLVGGKAGTAFEVSKTFLRNYPNLCISGFSSGYFNTNEQRTQTLQNAKLADIVIVGMGTPYQESFLIDLRKLGWSGTGFTCGGFFDQTVQKGMIYFPVWIDKANLRWLYRLYKEPIRLFKRYLFIYPKFVIFFLTQIFRNSLRTLHYQSKPKPKMK